MIGPRSRRLSGNCQKCSIWRQSLHREHIIPKFKGGTDDENNIQWLCANCHEDKTREDLKGKAGPNKGKVFSEEIRLKMSLAASRSQARSGHTKGRKLSEEHKEKIGLGGRGKHSKTLPPLSEQHKQKISGALKRYNAEHPRTRK